MKGKTKLLESIIRRELDNVIGLSEGKLSSDRLALKSAYHGDPYPVDEQRRKKGWSTYVDRTVMETVEWAKGPLLKVFAGTEDIVRFEPTGPHDEQYAEDATDYVNKVVFGRNAFDMVYGPLADALLQRVGWVKVYFDDSETRQVIKELVDLTEEDALLIGEQVFEFPDAEAEFEQDKETGLYSARVYWTGKNEQICVKPIPSERVLVSENATSIEDARFVAHWEERMYGELLEEGYSKQVLDEITSDEDDYPETERQRLVNSDDSDIDQGETKDGTRLIRVYEAYLSADIDGKGRLKKYKVTFCGDKSHCTVLDSEEWTMYRAPIFGTSALPMPYSPIGLSLADLVMDLQALRTELMRGVLDNVYSSNHGELHVNKKNSHAKINMDQLLSREAGGTVLSEGDVTINPLPVVASSANALAALELSDKAREQRTGIGMNNQGLSADVLQNTATGAAILEENQNIRLEMIARIFAEFYKQIAKYVLALACRYIKTPVNMRRQGSFSEITPALWNPAMEIVATVGLGTGNRQKKADSVGKLLAVQEGFVKGFGKASPVRMEHLVRTAHKFAETLGFEFPEQYFGTFEDAQKAEEMLMQGGGGEGEEAQKIKMQQQAKQAELQMKAQGEQAKLALQREKANAELANQAAKQEADMIIRVAELEQKGLLSQRQMELEAELDAIKLVSSLPAGGATEVSEVNTL